MLAELAQPLPHGWHGKGTALQLPGFPDQTAQIPLQRIGQPEEIASLAIWLASEESGYMTGASLTIDGGFVL
nr:SDR family oxidoreductase [Enterobacter soli]